MKKSNHGIISIILIILGLGCTLAYKIIGSSVDENGLLHEPFGLIPIGHLFIFLGIIFGIIDILKSVGGKK